MEQLCDELNEEILLIFLNDDILFKNKLPNLGVHPRLKTLAKL